MNRTLRQAALAFSAGIALAHASFVSAQDQRAIDEKPELFSDREEERINERAKRGITVNELFDILDMVLSKENAEYRARTAAQISEKHQHSVGLLGNYKWFYAAPFRAKVLKRIRKSGSVTYLLTPDVLVDLERIGYKRSVAMTIFATQPQPRALKPQGTAYSVQFPSTENMFPEDQVRIVDADMSILKTLLSIRKFKYSNRGNRFCEYQEYYAGYFPKEIDGEKPWLARLGMLGSRYLSGREEAAPVICYYDVPSETADDGYVTYTETLTHTQTPYWPSTDNFVRTQRLTPADFFRELSALE